MVAQRWINCHDIVRIIYDDAATNLCGIMQKANMHDGCVEGAAACGYQEGELVSLFLDYIAVSIRMCVGLYAVMLTRRWVLLNFQVRMPEYMGTCDCYKPAQRLQQACLITQRADSAIP